MIGRKGRDRETPPFFRSASCIDHADVGRLLTAAVLRACGRQVAGSVSDGIFSDRLRGEDVADLQRALGPRLPNLTLLSAGYSLNREETRALTRWLLQLTPSDPRYALARLLAHPAMRSFNYVIIDTAPRLTLATVNALCASTHVVVPTILDGMSTENIGGLLQQMDEWFRRDLNPKLQFAGIIATMTEQQQLTTDELRERQTVEERAMKHWGRLSDAQIAARRLDPWPSDAYVLTRNVPETVRFMRDAGRDIAYLDTRQTNGLTREVIESIGNELLARVHR